MLDFWRPVKFYSPVTSASGRTKRKIGGRCFLGRLLYMFQILYLDLLKVIDYFPNS